MTHIILIVLGMVLGSFINALVWRIHAQEAYKKDDGTWKKLSKQDKKRLQKLSITKGRSMCMHCQHELAPKDLVPVFSWLFLRGRCRYCKKPIDDTPVAEIVMPILLLGSYIFWPYADTGWGTLAIAVFIVWCMVATCFVALSLYDAKWYILPNRIVLPLTILALAIATLLAIDRNDPLVFLMALLGGITISGIFLALSLLSKGRWIGGGDIKLGISLGLLAGSPLMAVLVIFIASLLAMVYMVPSMFRGKMKLGSMLPFGPFLIAACTIVFLVGSSILTWYINLLTT